MYSDIAQLLTNSIDEISRRWVDELRRTERTDVHKQLLSSEIIGGVKGMLSNFAQAIATVESPDGDNAPVPFVLGSAQQPLTTTGNLAAKFKTRPLEGPLALARQAAASLGRLRHKQGYEIQEVLYEFVKLRQEIWHALRSSPNLPKRQSQAVDAYAYIDRLLDELMLTTVENFYNTSVHDLEKRAIRDPLTGLYNKDYFHQRLNEELRRSVRYAQPISVAMIDMDLLKTVNDTYGHPAGDEVIRAVATAIKDRCRQTDVPCRYGGDEFAVILPETTKAQARTYAERVVQALYSLQIVIVPGSHGIDPADTPRDTAPDLLARNSSGPSDASPVVAPVPTVSIGIASFPEDARNPETLLAKADEALYRSKHEGRNRISD